MDSNEYKYLIWLGHLYDIGAANQNRLLDFFASARNAYENCGEAAQILNGSNFAKLKAAKKNINPEKCQELMGQKNIRFIHKNQPEYPELLADISTAPFGIFVRGKMPSFDKKWINIIGSRKHSGYGKDVAYSLSGELSKQGAVIVSGMAEGLDSLAHKGALDNGGETVAVLGCGIDVCYPRGNESLYREIMEKGAIISEYPPGVSPNRWQFPARNRIMSGLCHATLVIEAAIASGTSITVDHALEQGREVLAVPGNITSPFSAGTNLMIKDGAHVATCAADVMDVLGIIKTSTEIAFNEEIHKIEDIPLAPNEKTVYALLGNEPMDLEYIIMESGLDYRNAAVALTNLEIGGRIKKLPGQRYSR